MSQNLKKYELDRYEYETPYEILERKEEERFEKQLRINKR